MAYKSDYTAGTVTAAAGGLAVTGTGTAWQTAGFQEGDIFIAPGWCSIIQSVNSNTSITLYPVGIRGAALSGSAYRLRYMSDGSRVSAQARALIDLLGGTGNLEALAGLTGAADKLPYFTNPGAMALATLTALGRTLIGTTTPAEGRSALGIVGRADFGVYHASGKNIDTEPAGSAALYSVSGNSGTFPPGASGAVWIETQATSSNNSRVQIGYNYANTGTPASGQWYRIASNADGTYSQWFAVGMEYGSNANGFYVRLAGGIQIAVCAPFTGYAANTNVNGTFPAAFVSGTIAAFQNNIPSTGWDPDAAVYPAGTSSWVFRSPTARANNVVIIVGIGRWQ